MDPNKRSAIFPQDDDEEKPQEIVTETKGGLLDTSSDEMEENGGFNLDDMGSL